jgi:hypothetical protein
MREASYLERRLADLYGHVLLEALSGPWARRLRQELGNGLVPLSRALLDRQDERLNSESATPIDDIDWAAIRVVAPAMLRLYDDFEFHPTTGHTLAELVELERLAIAAWREYRTPRHAISYRIGDCVVELPTGYIDQGVRLAATPDERSWNQVVPECARGRRDEFLGPLRAHFDGSGSTGTRVWEERPVSTMDELVQWVSGRAEAFRLRRQRDR